MFDPTLPVWKQAILLEIPDDPVILPNRAREILERIRQSARDVYPDDDKFREFVTRDDFDGTGLTGYQLIQKGRAVRILSRLDTLRFGSRG